MTSLAGAGRVDVVDYPGERECWNNVGEELWTVVAVAVAGALALAMTRGRASMRARKKLPTPALDKPTVH